MGGNISINNREALAMTNVREVLTFDTDFICVLTDDGKVEIEGDGMRIVSMSSESGEMTVIGRIDGVFYAKAPKKKGFFSKNG